MPDVEIPGDAAEALTIEEQGQPAQTPEPTATGNDAIAIYHHNLVQAYRESKGYLIPAQVSLAIGNETATHYAAVDFEAQFLDCDGNVVATARHTECDLRPNRSRGIHIVSPVEALDVVQSYAVRIVRTTTVDFEKVQLRRCGAVTTDGGEELVSGTVMNISDAKARAAVVATFYDERDDKIGMAVLVLRDIEPDAAREFELRFKLQEGDKVRRCTVDVGTLVG